MWAFHLLSEWVNVCSFALARNWTADSLFGNLFALKSIRPVAWEDENSFPQALILGKAGGPGLPNAFPMNSSTCMLYLGWNWDSEYLIALRPDPRISNGSLQGQMMHLKNNSYRSPRSPRMLSCRTSTACSPCSEKSIAICHNCQIPCSYQLIPGVRCQLICVMDDNFTNVLASFCVFRIVISTELNYSLINTATHFFGAFRYCLFNSTTLCIFLTYLQIEDGK